MKKIPVLVALSTIASLSQPLFAATYPVYFGTSGSEGIYRATFDSDEGVLSTPILVAELERPGFITFHPNHKFLYSTTVDVDDPKMGGVAAYAIQPDGSLKLLNRQSAQGRGTCHVRVDVMGNCLLAVNYSSGSTVAFKIESDGSLSPATSFHQHEGSGEHPKRQEGPHAHSIFTSTDNRYAYVPDLGLDKVLIYALDANNGKLTPAGSAKIPGGSMGPRHMKFLGDGKYAYVLNELDLSISVFKAVEEGQLELIKTYDAAQEGLDKTKMSAAEIRIHPSEKYIYCSNRDNAQEGHDSIAAFALRQGGAVLERIEVQIMDVSTPRNFNIDPSGNWMLVGGQRSHNIAIIPIDQSNGQLRKMKELVPFEGGPICIEFLH